MVILAVLQRIGRRFTMYLSLIITFLLLLVIIITAIQNSMPLDFNFFTWNFQISITALIFFPL